MSFAFNFLTISTHLLKEQNKTGCHNEKPISYIWKQNQLTNQIDEFNLSIRL